jgi:PAS domain S-box-containing protein
LAFYQTELVNSILQTAGMDFIATAHVPIFSVDVDMNVDEWNAMTEKTLGHSKKELLGTPFIDIIGEDDKEKIFAALTEALAGVNAANLETVVTIKSGRTLNLLMSLTTRRDVDGATTGVMCIAQDVTEYRNFKIERDMMIMGATAPVFGSDLNYKINEWNLRCEEWFGYTREEMMGTDVLDFFELEEDKAIIQKGLAVTLQGICVNNYKQEIKTKSGDMKTLLMSATPQYSHDGTITGVLGIAQDITEIDAATIEYMDLIKTAHAPIFGIDTDYNVNEWNVKAEETSGYSKQEVFGTPFLDLIQEEDRESVRMVLSAALDGTNTANYEQALQTKHGRTINLLINATTRRNNVGDVTGVIGVAQDITDLIALQPVLVDLEMVLNKCSDMISKHSMDGRYISVSDSFLSILGYKQEDLLGQNCYDFFCPDDIEHIRECHDRVVQTGDEMDAKSVVFDYRLRHKRGHFVHVETSSTIMKNREKDGSDTPVSIFCITRDVTDRIARHELETRLAVAENGRKKDVQANHFTRHEVKNGILNAQARIQGAKNFISSICIDAGVPSSTISEVRGQLNTISSELQHTLQVVLSEAMAKELINGMYKARMEVWRVKDIFGRIMDERVTFHSDIDALLELELDAELIWYICRNACSNALKYGHTTLPVHVFVAFDSGELVLRVINSPGPDHTQLVQLPNPNVVFDQGKRLHATLHAGESAGDGAWIMQQCAEAMSGTCSISFLEDKTVFDFRCPCDVHVMHDINEQYDIPEDTIVVVVDDSKMQRTALHRMLLSEGIHKSNVHMLGDKYQTLESLCMQIKSIISGKHFVLCILEQNLDYTDFSLR